jgi:hypothetical protein
MPTNLTEVDSYDANVSVPLGGDARTAASVTAGMQSLANRAKNHQLHKLGDSGGTFTLAAVLRLLGAGVEIGGVGLLCTGVLVASAGAVLTGGVSIDTALIAGGQLLGVLTNTGTGRIRLRHFLGANAANLAPGYGISDGDVLDASNITTGRAWNLNTAGAGDGDVIHVINPTLNLLTLGVGAGSFGLVNTSGNVRGMSLVFSSTLGDWIPLNYGKLP